MDYKGGYEINRERKGYGKRNLHDFLGSDQDDAARLQRNFENREMVEGDIETLHISEMFDLVEFLVEKIGGPLNERITGHFSGDADSSVGGIRPLDLVARRRLHWVGERCALKLPKYKAEVECAPATPLVAWENRCYAPLLKALEETLPSLRFDDAMKQKFGNLKENLQQTILDELTEELLYSTRMALPNPLDGSVWSSVAIQATREVAREIAKSVHCSNASSEKLRLKFLGVKILRRGAKYLSLVKQASEADAVPITEELDPMADLLFVSPERVITKNQLLSLTNIDENGVIDIYGKQLNMPYGAAATLSSYQAFNDSAELCGLTRFRAKDLFDKTRVCGKSIVSRLECGGWMPRCRDSFSEGLAKANVSWYVENQLLPVFHVLASACVDWSVGDMVGDEFYSLEKICKALELDVVAGKGALLRGAIKPSWVDIEPVSPSNSPTSKSKRGKKRRGGSGSPSKKIVYKGPDDNLGHGWTVEKVQRATGNHIDRYWFHSDSPEDVIRSMPGVRNIISRAANEGITLKESIKWFRGKDEFKKYFQKFK